MRNKLLLILVVAIVLFTSCKIPRYIYSPSVANAPYFTEKGQSKVSASYSGGGDDNKLTGEKNGGFDLQAGYSISDHLALTASYFNRKEKDVYPYKEYNFFDSSVVNYKRNLTEIGGGYFLVLTRRDDAFLNKGRAITFNIYGGVGLGKFSFIDAGKDNSGLAYSRYHDSRITKWFLQPSINFITGKYFRFSLIDKISFVHYDNISTSYTSAELEYFELNKLPGRTISFFEPSINMQMGVPGCDWLKIDGGFIFLSNPLVNNGTNLKSRGFSASIGLCFGFHNIKDKASPVK